MRSIIVFLIILIGFQFIETPNFLQTKELLVVTEIKDTSLKYPVDSLNLLYYGEAPSDYLPS